jgi:hypothetical protein
VRISSKRAKGYAPASWCVLSSPFQRNRKVGVLMYLSSLPAAMLAVSAARAAGAFKHAVNASGSAPTPEAISVMAACGSGAACHCAWRSKSASCIAQYLAAPSCPAQRAAMCARGAAACRLSSGKSRNTRRTLPGRRYFSRS